MIVPRPLALSYLDDKDINGRGTPQMLCQIVDGGLPRTRYQNCIAEQGTAVGAVETKKYCNLKPLDFTAIERCLIFIAQDSMLDSSLTGSPG
jgi:hypothetical protein